MSESEESRSEVLKITAEDLEKVSSPSEAKVMISSVPGTEAARTWGSISTMPDAPSFEEEKGGIWLKGWFYLGGAGFIGALVGWAVCEPNFIDGGPHRWGNILLLPLVVGFMCAGFAVAESAVERSSKKALIRTAIALPLGIVLGFIFEVFANLFFTIGLNIVSQMGVNSPHNPAFWVTRGIAWMVFGIAGGVVYGVTSQSAKKAGYGVLGGVIGSGLGGMVFDPISFAVQGGALSRAVGFSLLGMATGIAMGLVESALKDRWLYVVQGPLAGKQFILYKPQTVMGSDQGSDVYLFKDSNILPRHALLQKYGNRILLQPQGSVYIAGRLLQKAEVLESGSVIQIGRYSFRYQEKQRS